MLILQKGNLFDKKNRKQYLYKIDFFDSNLHIVEFSEIKKIIEFEEHFSFPLYKNSLRMDSQKVFQKKNHKGKNIFRKGPKGPKTLLYRQIFRVPYP